MPGGSLSFPDFSCDGDLVITGDDLRTARERRGWTQRELADALGVTFRSIGNWERGEVPATREARIRDVLGDDLTPGGNPLARASDLALVSELARRLASRGGGGGHDDWQSEDQKSWVSRIEQGETALAAQRGQSQGKMNYQEGQRLGEESQDDGDMDPA